MRLPRALLTVVAPLILLAADPVMPAEPAMPADTSAALTAVMSTFDLRGELVLERAGAEPRQVLRFHPRPGASDTIDQTQRMTMTMMVNGNAVPTPDIVTVTTTRATVGNPEADGNIPVRQEILRMQQTGGPANPGLDAMRGLTTEILVSPAGTIVGGRVSSGGDPAMAAALEQMVQATLQNMPHFPEEAVGVGGRWRTEFDLEMMGMVLVAEATNTVKSISDEAVVIEMELSLEAGNSTFGFPGMPSTAKVDLISLKGSGGGTMTLSLDTLTAAMSQKMMMDMEMSMSIDSPATSMPPMVMSMHMDQTMTTTVAQ